LLPAAAAWALFSKRNSTKRTATGRN